MDPLAPVFCQNMLRCSLRGFSNDPRLGEIAAEKEEVSLGRECAEYLVDLGIGVRLLFVFGSKIDRNIKHRLPADDAYKIIAAFPPFGTHPGR